MRDKEEFAPFVPVVTDWGKFEAYIAENYPGFSVARITPTLWTRVKNFFRGD